MKPNVGMLYPVASAVNTYTPYSSITYGTGFVVSEARGADVQWETENGEFYGDDILLDAAKGIVGYTIAFEAAGLADTVRAKLLGEVKTEFARYEEAVDAVRKRLDQTYEAMDALEQRSKRISRRLKDISEEN